jgi:hypothetical protein
MTLSYGVLVENMTIFTRNCEVNDVQNKNCVGNPRHQMSFGVARLEHRLEYKRRLSKRFDVQSNQGANNLKAPI